MPQLSGCASYNIRPLHRTHRFGSLNGRFDRVDIEALSSRLLLQTNLFFHAVVTGPIPYIGGKRRIAKQIVAIFPPHQTYVEAFAGGAQVFFCKPPSRVEVLNDLDWQVVNFFRVCQQHYEELLRCLRFMVVSRTWFELFEKQNPSSLTDIQRAARFLVLHKMSYAGLVRHQNYNYSIVSPPSFNPGRLPELIERTHERLQRVQLECLPYEQILERFDRPSTLHFCDPPYYGIKLYNYNFTDNDFLMLEQRLRALKGKFVLSLNDVPEVRRIFRGFRFQEIELAYTAQQIAGKRFRELLITNFEPKNTASEESS